MCAPSPSTPLRSKQGNESLSKSSLPQVAFVTPVPHIVKAPHNTDLGVFTSCVGEGIILNL
eukprot:1211570-Prorocentrum_lima.AAC.1